MILKNLTELNVMARSLRKASSISANLVNWIYELIIMTIYVEYNHNLNNYRMINSTKK